MPIETAILLAAFGSLQPSALATYENIKIFYGREFPNSEIRIAFTSDFIRRRLRDESISIQSPLMALANLQDQDFRDIVVQPLQIVPGIEFHEIASLVRCLEVIRGKLSFHSLTLGRPLLSSFEDCKKTSDALRPIIEDINALNEPKDRSGTATVLVGHGTGHPSDSLYSQMALILASSYKNVIFGTLKGYPGLNDVLSRLKENKIEKVVLIPFLLVAGGHALEDIAGSGQSSWRTILEREGLDVKVCVRGLGDEERIIKLFLEHTSDAMKKGFIPEQP